MKILLIVALQLITFAYAETDPYAGKMTMHGYRLNDFPPVEKKWKLVTVRFRKDTEELRFTYANEIAWKALEGGKSQYPKGAIFAKIGVATHEDPAFLSSAVPSGARRYQFMIRDETKFKETDGWGYLLFDAEGKTFPGEPKVASKACAACHHLVPERGYVFSQPMTLSAFTKTAAQELPVSRVQFTTLKVSALPENIRKHVPMRSKEYREVTGAIAENIFQGTLDEFRPTLTDESLRQSMPTILRNSSGKMFSIVYATGEQGRCAANEVEFIGINSIVNKDETHSLRFCKKLSGS